LQSDAPPFERSNIVHIVGVSYTSPLGDGIVTKGNIDTKQLYTIVTSNYLAIRMFPMPPVTPSPLRPNALL
jgi:hypothetical protein